MLVITRKVGESVVIDNKIVCTVLDSEREGELKLVFEAPRNISIMRSELQNKFPSTLKKRKYEREMNEEELVIQRLTNYLEQTLSCN